LGDTSLVLVIKMGQDHLRLFNLSYFLCFQRCFKMLPIVGVGILALVIAFGLWVRTVPPKVATNPIKVQQRVVNPGNKGTPDFMKVDTGPKNVVDEAAQEKLKDADQGETIEL
jgi:hypothetical protein